MSKGNFINSCFIALNTYKIVNLFIHFFNMKYVISLVFLFIVWAFTFTLDIPMETRYFVLFAALVWGYMAINIWANDVANNVWPAVWSKALTIFGAIVIAAIFEFAWAVIAGWEVVKTIKKWIIDISGFTDPMMFIFAMIAALAAAAIWLNIATYFKAPVSTTHSIVWWIMWAWIAALGVSVVEWGTMWKIAASWIISPVIWWVIAAFFLYLIKVNVLYKDDRVKQAKVWVPFFVSIMSWAFSTYIIIKWLKHLIKIDFLFASLIWLLIWLITYFLVKKSIFRKSSKMKNNRESINNLFTVPLIFAAALLSFAHWANDVANAIWPLSAIYDAAVNSSISTKVSIPLWIMLIGAGWITVWLALFGPRIIKTVWNEITELDKIRAFTIALSAAITVIIASQLWLPVSSTHIALGWIFGVWFLREYLHNKKDSKKEIFVKRDQVWKIAWAWIITVPSVAFMSGLIYVLLLNIA